MLLILGLGLYFLGWHLEPWRGIRVIWWGASILEVQEIEPCSSNTSIRLPFTQRACLHLHRKEPLVSTVGHASKHIRDINRRHSES